PQASKAARLGAWSSMIFLTNKPARERWNASTLAFNDSMWRRSTQKLCHCAGAVQSAAVSETLERAKLRDLQLERVRQLLDEILPRNAFYAQKLGGATRIETWDDFHQLPFTTKAEIAEDQANTPPFGTNLTYALERYTKLHQTSGTTGKAPIRVLDTPE